VDSPALNWAAASPKEKFAARVEDFDITTVSLPLTFLALGSCIYR
jgi:hypothetical protein